jgi:hypothetical protein
MINGFTMGMYLSLEEKTASKPGGDADQQLGIIIRC